MNQPAGSNVIWYGRELMREVDDASMQALIRGGLTLERNIKRSMKPGTSGNIRRVSKKRGKIVRGLRRLDERADYHIASSPGDPPAPDTGRLRASISTNWSGSGMATGKVGAKADAGEGVSQPVTKNTVRVGSNVDYALYLELGTPRMKKRPYIRPAFAQMKGDIEKFFRNALKPTRRK